MAVIQTRQGLDIKVFYNFFDCPHRGNCKGQKARESGLIKHRCSFNPSILDCEFYKKFHPQEKTLKPYNLNCL